MEEYNFEEDKIKVKYIFEVTEKNAQQLVHIVHLVTSLRTMRSKSVVHCEGFERMA